MFTICSALLGEDSHLTHMTHTFAGENTWTNHPTSKSVNRCQTIQIAMIDWAVLSDEQMSKGWPFSLLNDEQMSNWVGVVRTNQLKSENTHHSKFLVFFFRKIHLSKLSGSNSAWWESAARKVATILPEMHELRWVHSFTAGTAGGYGEWVRLAVYHLEVQDT